MPINPKKVSPLTIRESSYICDMVDKNKILTEVKRLVLENAPDAKIILYGSHARGEYKKDSDWDLLILLNRDKITREEEKHIKYPIYDLEFETGQVLSLMIYSVNEWESKYRITHLYKNIMKEGIVL